MIIDIFPHIFTKKYTEKLKKKLIEGPDYPENKQFIIENSTGTEIEIRLKEMSELPDVSQVLSVHAPPLEVCVTPKDAIDLARIANDEMAELVTKYPQQFTAAVACLPLNDIDESLKETKRAIDQLHFKGIQIYTNFAGETLDTPKFKPLYALMAHYDLPIWIHPWNPPGWKKTPFHAFSWPFQTSVAMVHLVRGGIFNEFPDIKFITHHCGGMVPSFYKRIFEVPVEPLRKFYGDTAVMGVTPTLMTGYAFFGPEHIVFGTDMRGSQDPGRTLRIIKSVNDMAIPEVDKKKIFEGNAKRLLKLP